MRRSAAVLAGVFVLAVCACDKGSPRATLPALTTTASLTLPPQPTVPSTIPEPTSTTRPTTSGCPSDSGADRPSASGPSHAWIQMVSARRGYAVVGRTIAGTIDGENWRPLYRAAEDLSYVDATDATHVWVVGTSKLFASTDAGRNWRTQSTAPRSFAMVHFVDAARGWAVAGGSLLLSVDGGRSWRTTPAQCSVDRVCFDDVQHGWIATHRSVYVTSDGGTEWSRALDASDESVEHGVAADLQCTAGHVAWVQFAGGNGATGHSAYAGYRCPPRGACVTVVKETFISPGPSTIEGPGSYPGPFSVIDDHTAAFVGNTPPAPQPMSLLVLSDDGRKRGATTAVPDGSIQQASALGTSFVSAERGWIVDSVQSFDTVASVEFHILATTDRGHTWKVQYRTTKS